MKSVHGHLLFSTLEYNLSCPVFLLHPTWEYNSNFSTTEVWRSDNKTYDEMCPFTELYIAPDTSTGQQTENNF